MENLTKLFRELFYVSPYEGREQEFSDDFLIEQISEQVGYTTTLIINECQDKINTLTIKQQLSLIGKYPIVIKMIDKPTEQMVQLHNMLWKI